MNQIYTEGNKIFIYITQSDKFYLPNNKQNKRKLEKLDELVKSQADHYESQYNLHKEHETSKRKQAENETNYLKGFITELIRDDNYMTNESYFKLTN